MPTRRALTALAACAGAAIALPFCVARATVEPTTTLDAQPAARSAAAPPKAAALPKFDHIVVVVEENHAFGSVIGNPDAQYINSLAKGGATMTESYAITHPSQPNYLALFSGSTQRLTDNSCPHTYSADNLGAQLVGAQKTFGGYSDGLPSTGYTGCESGDYVRKHNPWVNFTNVPKASNRPFTSFPADYTKLPDLSFVVPDLCHDMHDCSVADGDSWLKENLGGYAEWAKANNSLLLVTFDEDDEDNGNRIPMLFSGAHVKTGTYTEKVTHYSVLRTLQTLNGLGCVANSCSAKAITDIWN
jgi:phosphatidylinositol-3-phosphatase